MLKRLKHRIIFWLSRKLMPIIEDKEIISFVNKVVMIDGVKLTDNEMGSLRAEVLALEQMRIWKLMNDYFTNLAQKKMYVEANDLVDIIFVKTMLYTLEIQRTIIKNIKNS